MSDNIKISNPTRVIECAKKVNESVIIYEKLLDDQKIDLIELGMLFEQVEKILKNRNYELEQLIYEAKHNKDHSLYNIAINQYNKQLVLQKQYMQYINAYRSLVNESRNIIQTVTTNKNNLEMITNKIILLIEKIIKVKG